MTAIGGCALGPTMALWYEESTHEAETAMLSDSSNNA